MIEWSVGIAVGLVILYLLANKFESLKNEPTEKLYEILEDKTRYKFWFKTIQELVNRGEDMTYLKDRLLDEMESENMKERVLGFESFKIVFPTVIESIGYKPHKVPEQDMREKLASIRTGN